MKKLIAWSACGLMVVVLAAGCSQTSSETGQSETASTEMGGETMEGTGMTMEITVDKATELGKISVAIEKEPERTTAILEEHGMTEADLQMAMTKIGESEELTMAYDAARKSAMEGEGH